MQYNIGDLVKHVDDTTRIGLVTEILSVGRRLVRIQWLGVERPLWYNKSEIEMVNRAT